MVDLLERFNIVDRHRVKPIVDLAWPRVLTGFARMSQSTADLAMVGWVLGPQAIAGIAFAYAYWQIGNRLSLGLSGGTISLVSQHFGVGDNDTVDQVVKQSVWLGLMMSIPIIVVLYVFAEEFIALFGVPTALEYGTTYLRVVIPALAFEFLNKIASRGFAGIGDTETPMYLRAGGALLNIVLNAVFIFGLGLGVMGAALGTLIATVVITAGFAWGLFGFEYPRRGKAPLSFRLRGPHWNAEIVRQLLRISTPLMFRRLADSFVIFPLLGIAGVFGAIAVSAFEIARRVRDLMNSLSWGFSVAASTLVGQYLGRTDEEEAEAYGWDAIRLSLVAYICLAAIVIIFARPVALVFVSDPETVELTRTFIRVGAIAAIGLGVDGTIGGALMGSGDTRWPFYGKLFGLYVFAVPIAFFGTVNPVGILALYAALIVETFIPAAFNLYRFQTNEWKLVSRSFRPSSDD